MYVCVTYQVISGINTKSFTKSTEYPRRIIFKLEIILCTRSQLIASTNNNNNENENVLSKLVFDKITTIVIKLTHQRQAYERQKSLDQQLVYQVLPKLFRQQYEYQLACYTLKYNFDGLQK